MAEAVFFRTKRLDVERARELYDKGYCDQQIADACGVSYEAVRVWRRKSGLEGHLVPYKKKTKSRAPVIIASNAEARAHKMSYGQYVAARREGKL